MVSHKKLFFAVVVLVVAAVSSQPQPPIPQHVSAGPPSPYSNGDVDDVAADRQAGLGVALGALLLPLITSVFSSFASNIGTSLTNALGATMAGAKLELIPVEVMIEKVQNNYQRYPLLPLERRRHSQPPSAKSKSE